MHYFLEQLGVSANAESIIDWSRFSAARAELGTEFTRILGYFREDGTKSVNAIEAAMRVRNAVQLVIPAHTLKGEARQFGAEALGDLAEEIETMARNCIEWRTEPDEALPNVARLRTLFVETLEALDRASNPVVERRGFGRKTITAHQP